MSICKDERILFSRELYSAVYWVRHWLIWSIDWLIDICISYWFGTLNRLKAPMATCCVGYNDMRPRDVCFIWALGSTMYRYLNRYVEASFGSKLSVWAELCSLVKIKEQCVIGVMFEFARLCSTLTWVSWNYTRLWRFCKEIFLIFLGTILMIL